MKHRAIIQFTTESYLEQFPEPIEVVLVRFKVSGGTWRSYLPRYDNLCLSELFNAATGVIDDYFYTVLMEK